MRAAASDPGFRPERVVGIGVDTTGSTPIPVDRTGRPLAMLPEFAHDLAAHAWLWKDHTGYAEAAEITEKAKKVRDKYLNKCGGAYSSEWYWSKILHCKRSSPQVFQAAYSWVELADFVPAFITGNLDPDTLPRGICAAGHKAMYHEGWGGLPSAKFLGSLDPDLALLRDRYAARALTSDQKAGSLTAEVAAKVGLPAGVAVAVGAFDAHMGAVGAGIKAGTLVKIIGTSTCDMMVAPDGQRAARHPRPVRHRARLGAAEDVRAGGRPVGGGRHLQLVRQVARCPAQYSADGDAHAALTREAEQLRPGASGLVALDWNNGNRTILVDPLLTRPAGRPDAAHHGGGRSTAR